jgi:hypothetical protein
LADQVKKNEMGVAYSMYGGEDSFIQGFGGGNLREKDLGIDGRIISKWIFKKWYGGMEWIDVAQLGTNGGVL